MLFLILNFFIQTIIIILLIRYLVERYRYYGFGPVMVAVITLTERIIKPVKQLLPRSASRLSDHTPLFAIAVVLLIRGLLIWVLQTGASTPYAAIHLFGGGGLSPAAAIAVSFAMGAQLIAEMTIAFLFASLMISRRGVNMGYNGGFQCFQDRTFALFQLAKRVVPSSNLTVLFFTASTIVLIGASFLAAALNLSFLYGPQFFMTAAATTMFSIILTLLNLYWFILLMAIITSWIGADQLSVVVQIVRAMSDPYLDLFRRLMPWARIDFIDLSPIFAFLVLNPGVVFLITTIQMHVLQSLAPVQQVMF